MVPGDARVIGSTDGSHTLTVTVSAARSTRTVELTWRWVRDHSEDPTATDPVTLQRTVDTFTLGAVPAGRSEVRDGDLVVHWPDGAAASTLGARLLAELAGFGEAPPPVLWDAERPMGGVPAVDWARVADDAGLLEWLEAVDRLGVGVVRGLPETKEAVADLAARIGPVRHTVFGGMWSLSSELTDHKDSAYSHTYLEPHTDSTYLPDAPGLQLFACRERSGTGGESILVDGFAAVERLGTDAPEVVRWLTEVSVPGRYVEPGVDLRASRPAIRLDLHGRPEQVSFNNYDRAPFLLPPADMAAWYDAYARFHAEIVDRRHWLTVGLTPGDVLLFDNWRVLHGRTEYVGRRVFEGCYVNREDFLSRLRVLRAGTLRDPAPA